MTAPSCWHRAAASYRRDALDAIALLAARAAEIDELRDELTVVRAAHDELARRYDELRAEDDEPEDDEPEPEDDDCPRCQGTGIGHGPPDVSRCGQCGGSGLRRRERDWGDRADEAYERERDC